MNTKKFLIGAVVGGVVFFLGGYLIWGNLLAEFMNENSAPGINRPMDGMIFWSLIAGNLLYGALLSYVLNKSNANSMSQGMMTAGVVGLLLSAAVDLTIYGTSTVYSNLNAVFVDIAAMTVLSSVTGGVIGWAMHYLGKAETKTAH